MTVAKLIRQWFGPVLVGLICGIALARLSSLPTRHLRISDDAGKSTNELSGSGGHLEARSADEPVGQLTVNDLEFLASSILKEPWPTRFNRVVLGGVLSEFASKYPQQFLTWMVRVTPGQDLTWAVNLALAGLLGENPEVAMQAVSGLRSRSLKLDCWTTILQSIAATNPAKAMALLSRVDSQFRPRLTSIIAEQWGKSDPAAAIRFLTKVDMPAVQLHGLQSLFWRWAESDFAAAQNWAKENNLQRSFISSLTANASPSIAARALLESPIRNKEIQLRNLARRWAAENPGEAVRWASTLENARDRAVMTRALLDSATERDPSTAASILDYIPSRDLREGFYRKFAQEKTASNPQGAMGWAASLTDPVSRMSASRVILGTWAGNDPQAALDYVYSKALTSNERYAWLVAVVDGSGAVKEGGAPGISRLLEKLPLGQRAEVGAAIDARIRAGQQSPATKNP